MPADPGPSPRSYPLWPVVTGLVVAAALIVYAAFPAYPGPGPFSKNLSNARQMGLACRVYALDHDGRFPVHLSELEPVYLEAGALNRLRYDILSRDKSAGEAADWLYYGAGFEASNAPRILIAAPQAYDRDRKQYRVFVQGDLAAMNAIESKFQTMLTETVGQMRKMEDARRAKIPPASPPKDPAN